MYLSHCKSINGLKLIKMPSKIADPAPTQQWVLSECVMPNKNVLVVNVLLFKHLFLFNY